MEKAREFQKNIYFCLALNEIQKPHFNVRVVVQTEKKNYIVNVKVTDSNLFLNLEMVF